MRLKFPQTLKSQKFSIHITFPYVFSAIVDVHIFKSVKSLSAFKLIKVLAVINVELVSSEDSDGAHLVKREYRFF